MKETHKHIAIGTVVGLYLGQLIVSFVDCNNQEHIVMLVGMFVGMIIGAVMDHYENNHLKKNEEDLK